jgi:hypothetical protein
MSLAYKPLIPVLVYDPVTDVKSNRYYAVLQSGKNVTYKYFTTTTLSPASFQFTTTPPSPNTIISRKVMITVPIRLIFTGLVTTTNAGFAPPTSLLNSGFDGPRAYPFSSMIDTLQANINNDSVNINLADVLHALLHYNTDNMLKSRDYSFTPNYEDQSFNYADLHNSIKSPLAYDGDGKDGLARPRGGFSFKVVQNATVIPTTAGTTATAIVDMVVTEPIFLSPFSWQHKDEDGFFNVNTMDFNFTMLSSSSQGARAWSHDALTPVNSNVAGNNVFTTTPNIQVQFNQFTGPAFSYNQIQPQMLFKYITPNVLYRGLSYDTPLAYPYWELQRYPTEVGVIPFGTTISVSSNNIMLKQIPRKLLIWARINNQTLYNRADLTDTYYVIQQVQIQFANMATLLSSASQQQLFLTNVKNGSDQEWISWSGLPVNNPTFPPNAASAPYGGQGSVLALRFGEDIQIDQDETPSLNGNYQLLVTVTLTNMNSSGAWDALPVTLYLCPIYEGVFTIEKQGNASHQLSVLTRNDVLDAKPVAGINYDSLEVVGGGDFLSTLKSIGESVNNFLKGSKLISTIAPHLPIPGAATIGRIAQSIGYGEGEGCYGGKRMTKAQMKRSLMHR